MVYLFIFQKKALSKILKYEKYHINLDRKSNYLVMHPLSYIKSFLNLKRKGKKKLKHMET